MALQRSQPFALSPRTGLALFAAMSLLAGAAPAIADNDDDTEDLLRLIKKSKVVDLSHPWDKDSPVASVNPTYSFNLEATHANTRGTFGDGGQLSFTAEVQHWSGQHGAPSIDAIGHIGRDGKLLGIGSLFSQVVFPGLGSIPCNVFIPVDLLGPILNDLIAKGRPGKAPRPWLGVNVEEAHGRVFVKKVTPGGPAEKGGFQEDDLILTVNGKPVSGLADLYRKVWALGEAGVEAAFRVLRGIEIREVKVRTADRYQFLHLKPIKKINITF